MDYGDYVRQISFRLFQPSGRNPLGFRALDRLARRAGLQLEVWMTRLPEEQESMQRRLRRAMRLRRRSTFAIGAIINRGVGEMPDGEVFLNLGVGSGFSLLAAMAGHRRRTCIGVDRLTRRPSSREAFVRRFHRAKGERHEFHEQDFRDYLTREHHDPVGYCVCGNLSTHRDLLEALLLIEPHLADRARVLVSNANRPEVRDAAAEFLARSPNEYHVMLDVKTSRSRHPTFGNGLLLIERGGPKSAWMALPETHRRAA